MKDSEEKNLVGGRSSVIRRGNAVHRSSHPWTPSVHLLLQHLEKSGFTGCPRVIGTGFDALGMETLSYIEGECVHHAPWSDEGIIAVGTLLRQLHQAAQDFNPSPDVLWRPWFGRNLRKKNLVYGHGDFAPWNLITHKGIPFAAIDWENAGPVDALVELAHVCWLNVQLCDDDVAERAGLQSLEGRAQQLRLLVDAYGLSSDDRKDLVNTMIDVAISDAADQAIEAKVTPDTTTVEPLWGLAWRTRAAAWLVKNRLTLQNALN